MVLEPFAGKSVPEPDLVQQVDGRLFENAGPHAVLDVVAAARFDDHRLDALEMQQVGKRQSGRAGADDRDLRAS